jgi:hypothetical protein
MTTTFQETLFDWASDQGTRAAHLRGTVRRWHSHVGRETESTDPIDPKAEQLLNNFLIFYMRLRTVGQLSPRVVEFDYGANPPRR